MYSKRPANWRALFIWTLLVIGLIILVKTERSVLEESFDVLRHANVGISTAAFLVSLATTVAGAWTYQLLSLRALPFPATWIVQVAGLFVGRVIPAGIGGIGLNYRYLRLKRLSGAQAGSTIAMNNLIGVSGNVLLLLAVIPFWAADLHGLTVFLPRHLAGLVLVVAAMLLAAAAVILSVARFNGRLEHRLRSFSATISQYKRRLPQAGLAVVTSLLLTSCNALALTLSAHALGNSLSFAAAVAVFSFGIVLTVATPTPGGIGGAEASLAGALIVAGLSAPQAIATALLFRLVNFWLPLIPGALALVLTRHKRWI